MTVFCTNFSLRLLLYVNMKLYTLAWKDRCLMRGIKRRETRCHQFKLRGKARRDGLRERERTHIHSGSVIKTGQ